MTRADSQFGNRARGTVPRLVAGVNIRDLPIGPEEAFVLSRIDGVNSEAEIAAATNLGLTDVARIVARLAELGAVSFGALQPADDAAHPLRPSPTQSGAYRISPITETQEARASSHPAHSAATSESAALLEELEEQVDLGPEQKQQLLALYQRLASANHYELLSVEPHADDKAVRAAYYLLVRVFHPDRFFGKNLGGYKPKLVKVFARITEAYETLHRSESRAEYDRYLAARQRTLDFERQLFDKGQQAAEVASALDRIERAARAESLNAPAPSGSAGSMAPPSSGTSVRHSLPPASDAERRRALARKLGHSSAPPARVSSTPPASAAVHAAEELKRRYESRLLRARRDQREHYVAMSQEAVARNDLAAAANALRIACTLAPDDLELANRLAALESRASAELWEAYVERGKYAAFEGRHAEAAVSYERAAAGRPNPSHFERAAFHSLEAGADPKHAVLLAKQAVALAPNSAKCRLTLAQAYFAGKLRESALAELERARALEPEQPLIKEWIQRAKRGEV